MSKQKQLKKVVNKKYIVTMTRIGYSHCDIEVIASNEDEAKEKAYEEAGNYEYSEHASDYEIEGISESSESTNKGENNNE
jgi:hypothetical protein